MEYSDYCKGPVFGDDVYFDHSIKLPEEVDLKLKRIPKVDVNNIYDHCIHSNGGDFAFTAIEIYKKLRDTSWKLKKTKLKLKESKKNNKALAKENLLFRKEIENYKKKLKESNNGQATKRKRENNDNKKEFDSNKKQRAFF